MAEDPTATTGRPFALRLPVRPEQEVTLTSLTVSLREVGTGATLTGATVTAVDAAGNPAAYEQAILLEWTPDADADAAFLVSGLQHPASGSDVPFEIRGRILVWPVWSALDEYIGAVKDFVQETEAGEMQQRLSQRDYRNALRTSLRAFNLFPNPVTAYTLTHTESTIPADDFQSITLYAAGFLLAGPLSSQASHTEEPAQGMGLVSYTTQAERLLKLGKFWMEQARGLWATAEADDGLQTGTLTLADPSPWSRYVVDLEEAWSN